MTSAQGTLDQYFLEMRMRCLSLAADLDRIQRQPGGAALIQGDPNLRLLRQAIGLLFDGQADRAQRVLELFSDKTPPPKASP
jgi:hypothetical protein